MARRPRACSPDFFKTPGDIDIRVINPELTAQKLLPYFQQSFGKERVRISEGGKGIELFHPESKKWAHAVDIHQWEKHSPIGRYDLPGGPDFSAADIRWMSLQEQFLRKGSASSLLRRSPEGRVLSPEMHRGKDIADTIIGIREAKLMWSESRMPGFYKQKHIAALEAIESDIFNIQLKPGYLPGSIPVKLTWKTIRDLENEIQILKSSPNRGVLEFDIKALEIQKNKFNKETHDKREIPDRSV
jgi:hypothetical protein